jgi:hypothetical protein
VQKKKSELKAVPLEYFPNKKTWFVKLFDGRLKRFGIGTEVDGLTGKLIAPDGTVTVVQKTVAGRSSFVGKMPVLVRNAIAQAFNLDFIKMYEGTHAVVEGPALNSEDLSSALFIIGWLKAAVDSDRLLQAHLGRNPSLQECIARLEIGYRFEFAPAAVAFIRKWQKDGCSFSIDLRKRWAEIFTAMVGIGFFAFTEDRYQMVMPPEPTIEVITEALVQLAETEDEQCYLHPGRHLVTTMPCEVKTLRKWLRDRRRHRFFELTATGREALASGSSVDNGSSAELG